MNGKYIAAAFTLATGICSFSAAAEESSGVGVALAYGAFSGPTLELSYAISDTLQVRGAISSGMSLTETFNTTGAEYEADASGGIQRLLIDYHPFDNGFFVSGGYSFNSFEISAVGEESGLVDVGDQTVEGNISLDALADWDNAPSLTIGWGHSPSRGFGFLIEAGAYFTGAANITVTGTCSSSVDGGCDGFDEALDEEAQELEDEISDFNVLPMIQAGISYRF